MYETLLQLHVRRLSYICRYWNPNVYVAYFVCLCVWESTWSLERCMSTIRSPTHSDYALTISATSVWGYADNVGDFCLGIRWQCRRLLWATLCGAMYAFKGYKNTLVAPNDWQTTNLESQLAIVRGAWFLFSTASPRCGGADCVLEWGGALLIRQAQDSCCIEMSCCWVCPPQQRVSSTHGFCCRRCDVFCRHVDMLVNIVILRTNLRNQTCWYFGRMSMLHVSVVTEM